jgi:hypothetical protein
VEAAKNRDLSVLLETAGGKGADEAKRRFGSK